MKSMTVYFVPHSTSRGKRPPRSDTLFGAICWGYKLLFGKNELDRLLHAFTGSSVPFLVSSMFLYSEHEGKKTHYLPKPLSAPLQDDLGDLDLKELDRIKNLKKRQIVTDNEFEHIIQGNNDGSIEPQSKQVRVDQRQVPHSSINRLTWTVDESLFFYTEELSLPAEAGLFFCLKIHEEFERNLKTVLYFLADKGIGGGASVGKGHFKSIHIKDALPFDEPGDDAKHVVTLSLTYPDKELRTKLPDSWYTLEKRQGKIESMYAHPKSGHIWKDHVLMLQEGSTFPKNTRAFYGKNPVVRKAGDDLDFDVQHYGYAFTVNTKHIPQQANDEA